MPTAKFSEDVRPITDLKAHASEMVTKACASRRPLLLTRRGRGIAVLLGLDAYEQLEARAAFVDAVREGALAMDSGDLHPNADAEAILESFGR